MQASVTERLRLSNDKTDYTSCAVKTVERLEDGANLHTGQGNAAGGVADADIGS